MLPRDYSRGVVVVAALVMIATAAGVFASLGVQYTYVSIAAIAGILALFKSSWGVLGYLAISSVLPGSEGVALAEISNIGLLGWLFVLATLKLVARPLPDRQAAMVPKVVYGLCLGIGVSWLMASQNGIAFTEWARDVAPLANIAMLVVVPAFIRHERDVLTLRTLVIWLLLVVGFHDAWFLAGQIFPGRPYFDIPFVIGGSWVAAVLVAGGAVGLSEGGRLDWRYAAMGLFGLVIALLTETRTIWVGVAGVLVLSLAGNLVAGGRRHLRGAALLLLAVCLVGALLVYWRSASANDAESGAAESWASHRARLETLRDVNDDQSFDIRKRQIAEALRVFAGHPLFGVGLGYQYLYTIPYTTKYDRPESYNHCDPANYLAKMGLFGAGCLYLVLIQVLALCGRVVRTAPGPDERWFARFTQVSLLAAMLMGLSTPVLQERNVTFFLGILLGLLVATASTHRPGPAEVAPAARAVGAEEVRHVHHG